MTATLSDIKGWLKRGEAQKATHMIVVCDSFEYDNYPVYVMEGEDVYDKAANYNNKDMQFIDEVYDFSMDIDEQLSEARAWNPDVRGVG